MTVSYIRAKAVEPHWGDINGATSFLQRSHLGRVCIRRKRLRVASHSVFYRHVLYTAKLMLQRLQTSILLNLSSKASRLFLPFEPNFPLLVQPYTSKASCLVLLAIPLPRPFLPPIRLPIFPDLPLPFFPYAVVIVSIVGVGAVPMLDGFINGAATAGAVVRGVAVVKAGEPTGAMGGEAEGAMVSVVWVGSTGDMIGGMVSVGVATGAEVGGDTAAGVGAVAGAVVGAAIGVEVDAVTGAEVGCDTAVGVGAATGEEVGAATGVEVDAVTGADVGGDTAVGIGAVAGEEVGGDTAVGVGAATGEEVGVATGAAVGAVSLTSGPMRTMPGWETT